MLFPANSTGGTLAGVDGDGPVEEGGEVTDGLNALLIAGDEPGVRLDSYSLQVSFKDSCHASLMETALSSRASGVFSGASLPLPDQVLPRRMNAGLPGGVPVRRKDKTGIPPPRPGSAGIFPISSWTPTVGTFLTDAASFL